MGRPRGLRRGRVKPEEDHRMSVETRFGPYGGRFVPETLMPALDELTAAYEEARGRRRLPGGAGTSCSRDYVGRPTPLYYAERLCRALRRRARATSSARTSATPARTRSTTPSARRCSPSAWASAAIIAETGAGQHGVATATACALLRPRVRRLHGRGGHARARRPTSSACACSAPRSIPVAAGSRTLKDATNEAMRDWVTNVRDTHYFIGSVVGPAPYPDDGARLPVGDRPRGPRADAASARAAARRVVACVGGGSQRDGHVLPVLDDARCG